MRTSGAPLTVFTDVGMIAGATSIGITPAITDTVGANFLANSTGFFIATAGPDAVNLDGTPGA